MNHIFPELLGPRCDLPAGPWQVRRGSAIRGGASCNLHDRILTVPDGDDEISRLVRAHELMHARVSPLHVAGAPEMLPGERYLEVAEELRVNCLLQRTGFDVTMLCDGSELSAARSLGLNEAWADACAGLAAVMLTKGETLYLRGLRQTQPSWLPALRTLRKALRDELDRHGSDQLSSTDQTGAYGYRVTITLASILERAGGQEVPTSDQLSSFRRSLRPGARRGPSNRFAPLVWLETDDEPGTSIVAERIKRRYEVTGSVVVNPERLLTDPHQRLFRGRPARWHGVILIDQSGSMAIEEQMLEDLLRKRPVANVIGYSHRPGDQGSTANIWWLARQGRRTAELREGNVGNGVDGPALRSALAVAGPRGRVIWVTDGQVTDSNDHPAAHLARECAELVRRHRIELVRSPQQLLGPPKRQNRGNLEDFGRVGRILQGIG